MIALLDLNTPPRLHLPSTTHGVALCGLTLPYPWAAGPLAALYARCEAVCRTCFEEVSIDGSGS